MWIECAVIGATNLSLPRPARVCIVGADGSVLYERRCYISDRSTVNDLHYAVAHFTVADLVGMYSLPVTLD
jgi:hypothetical protein